MSNTRPSEKNKITAEEQIKGLRRQRYLIYGLAILLLGTGIITAVALKQRAAAQKATGIAEGKTQAALAATSKTSELASRRDVSLARCSSESGNNAQAFAYLAEALRLNPENREATSLIVAMLVQLSWHPSLTSMRHGATVRSLRFSPDGQRMVTASDDGTARLWEAASGKPIGEPMKHQKIVLSARFSPDGQRVVTASWDKTARLWDAVNGFAIGEPMKHENNVTSAQFSPDGKRVVTASWDKTAQVWDAANRKPIGRPMKHEEIVTSAQFSPDGQRVVTTSGDGTARLWNAASGKPIGEPMEHKGDVRSAQFSPDGQRVVTVSGTARLWDLPAATKKDTKEDIFLLCALSETMRGVTLENAQRPENLTTLKIQEKIAARLTGVPSKLSPLQRFLKWCVADRRNRTISPFSQITVSEWLETKTKEGTVEGLRAALHVDSANPRITAHLGRRLLDYALEPALDPDEARRVRGEADFLTTRALKLAPNDSQVKGLRDQVVKLLRNTH